MAAPSGYNEEAATAPAAASAPTAASSDTEAAVDPERKRALLLEARRDRVAWVDAASAPLRGGAEWGGAATDPGRGLEALRSARACLSIRSAVDVAEALYCARAGGAPSDDFWGRLAGMTPQEAGERVKRLLESEIQCEDVEKAMAPPVSVPMADDSLADGVIWSSEEEGGGENKHKTTKKPGIVGFDDDDKFTASYRAFLQKLRSPECAELVQGMRRFVNSFDDKVSAAVAKRKKKRNDNSSKGGENNHDEDVRRLASAIRVYVDKTFDAIKAHPQWKGVAEKEPEATSWDAVKDSLEAFVFAKCFSAMWSIVSDDETDDDATVQERLAELQFITPKHLDIHCLADIMSNGTEEMNDEGKVLDEVDDDGWMALFSAPIGALRSVERHCSPAKMLSCIHNVYRGVNEALSSAMVSANKSGKAMPGADDVLPALILVVLRAQPRHIVTNLRFVDLFATPTQLRGEAGYAYTNLFSAVQFLRDMDLNRDSGLGNKKEGAGNGVASLSITPEEFRTGLEKCRRDAESEAEVTVDASLSKDSAADPDPKPCGQPAALSVVPMEADLRIPAHDVQTARLHGEITNIEWAHKWLEGRQKLSCETGENHLSPRSKYPAASTTFLLPPLLPDGFSRSYAYLAMGPDDIRISDVPQLLKEYKILVKTTESLLAERAARAADEHKRQVQLTRNRLESSAKEFSGKVNGTKK